MLLLHNSPASIILTRTRCGQYYTAWEVEDDYCSEHKSNRSMSGYTRTPIQVLSQERVTGNGTFFFIIESLCRNGACLRTKDNNPKCPTTFFQVVNWKMILHWVIYGNTERRVYLVTTPRSCVISPTKRSDTNSPLGALKTCSNRSVLNQAPCA
jgi:hypothetical protein